MRARAGIVVGLVTLCSAACEPSTDRATVGSRPPGSSPSVSLIPEAPTTLASSQYAGELAEVAQLAKLVDAFCACQDRGCRHRARTRIHAISDALAKKLPSPPPEQVVTAAKRAVEPMGKCEEELFPAPERPLPAPARLLARASTCTLQTTRDAVFFTTAGGALKRASFDGNVMEILPAGVLQQSWIVGRTFVYYGVQDMIRRIPVRGGRAQQIVKADWPETRLTQFALDRTHVYWEEGLLHRKPKAGGGVADIANAHGPLLHLTVSGGYVYYSNGASIGRARATGGEPTIILASSSEDNPADRKQDRPRLDLPFVGKGAYVYGRTEQCGVFRVPKTGGAASILTKGASPRDRYFGCSKGDHLSVGKSVLFEVATPEDEVLLEVPLSGGEPKEVLSAGHTTICSIEHWGSKPLVSNEHGIWRIGW